ncbi:MAG: hypothetical protein ACOCV1_02260 [Bacillota bacterium]
MKKLFLLVLTSIIFLGIVSCVGEETTDLTTVTTTYNETVIIEIEEQEHVLGFSDSNDKSLFELIEESDIELSYYETDFGNMITKIGSIKDDSFHWISFTKNNDLATEGLDTIAYEDGDVFTFTAALKTWQQTYIAEYQGEETNGLQFALNDESFYIVETDLPNEWSVSSFVEGMRYEILGSLDSNKLDEEEYYIIPDNIEKDVITDFTDLSALNEGNIVYLQFKVTGLEESSNFGYEVFAEDINGLSSENISENLNNPYSTDYIFYTFPDEIILEIGKTYIARFIFKTFEPNNNPQFGLYKNNIQGEETDYFVIEIEE